MDIKEEPEIDRVSFFGATGSPIKCENEPIIDPVSLTDVSHSPIDWENIGTHPLKATSNGAASALSATRASDINKDGTSVLLDIDSRLADRLKMENIDCKIENDFVDCFNIGPDEFFAKPEAGLFGLEDDRSFRSVRTPADSVSKVTSPCPNTASTLILVESTNDLSGEWTLMDGDATANCSLGEEFEHPAIIPLTAASTSTGTLTENFLNSGSINEERKGTEFNAKAKSKKCRWVYGVDFRYKWCTSCKWKKKCARFIDPSAQIVYYARS